MTEILWIDNDCNDEYKDFVDVIEAHGYKATAVETVPEGLELLKKDMNRFSAIITDARGKTEKTGPEDLGSLKGLERELMRLWNKRYIPYYIYTGKKAVYESETFKEEHKEFFRKGLEDDKLFARIETDLGQLPEIQIEYMYQDVIDAARKVIGKKKTVQLIKLLKGIHFMDCRPEEPPKNLLRAIMCACLKTFIKYGLVPEECLRKTSNLPIYDDVREYLSGQRAIHTCGEITIGGVMDAEGPVFGEVMAQHLEDIMNYVNAGSHEEGDDDEDEFDFRQELDNLSKKHKFIHEHLDSIMSRVVGNSIPFRSEVKSTLEIIRGEFRSLHSARMTDLAKLTGEYDPQQLIRREVDNLRQDVERRQKEIADLKIELRRTQIRVESLEVRRDASPVNDYLAQLAQKEWVVIGQSEVNDLQKVMRSDDKSLTDLANLERSITTLQGDVDFIDNLLEGKTELGKYAGLNPLILQKHLPIDKDAFTELRGLLVSKIDEFATQVEAVKKKINESGWEIKNL